MMLDTTSAPKKVSWAIIIPHGATMIYSLWVEFWPNCMCTFFFYELANHKVWFACIEVFWPVSNSNSSLSSSTSASSEMLVTSFLSESLGCATHAWVRCCCSWNLYWLCSMWIFSMAQWSSLLQVFEPGTTVLEHPMIVQVPVLSWWCLQYWSWFLDRGVWQLWTLQHGFPTITLSMTTTETLHLPVRCSV